MSSSISDGETLHMDNHTTITLRVHRLLWRHQINTYTESQRNIL